MRKFRFVMDVFTTVTTCVLVAVGLFTTVFFPVERIKSTELWQILIVSFLCAVSVLIYPEDSKARGISFKIQVVVHYLLINAIVLGFGAWFGWYDLKNPLSVFVMALVIAVIFAVVSGVTWRRSKREAQELNERLREYQNHGADRE